MVLLSGEVTNQALDTAYKTILTKIEDAACQGARSYIVGNLIGSNLVLIDNEFELTDAGVRIVDRLKSDGFVCVKHPRTLSITVRW